MSATGAKVIRRPIVILSGHGACRLLDGDPHRAKVECSGFDRASERRMRTPRVIPIGYP